jgi:hypothetical protein
MVSAVKTEPGRLSDWLLFESDEIGRYSRDVVTVATNQTLKSGAVVGLNAAGEVMEYDNETATSAGGAVAVGIIGEDVTTTSATKKSFMVARHARVAPSGLVWKTGLLTADKDAAWVDLKAVGIIPVPAEF